ncbi:DNA (cytosine-5-)-methyltransferase [Rhodococcus sp. NPDC006774]|uniref:DNA cytosine methyltransferase n=1 Tax=Rhodococcus sp. NPDC006774 TaxID=3157186 RepID=UPI0033E8CA72
MNVLSLFSGIGGLELGLERAGMTVVGQVEINPYATQVLERHWPNVPRHDDVRTTIDWWRSEPRPPLHVVAGGFPCQDVSDAGPRIGITGARSALWNPMCDIVNALRPNYVIVENTPGLLARGMGRVLGDLADIGYDAEWQVLSAGSFGAPHLRKRVFIVAYPQGVRERQLRWSGSTPESTTYWGVRGQESEPPVARVADGVPHRVDRLTALGNAVVPQVAEHIGRMITEAN